MTVEDCKRKGDFILRYSDFQLSITFVRFLGIFFRQVCGRGGGGTLLGYNFVESSL